MRAFEWLGGRAARVRLRQPALGGRPARAATEVVWNPRFLHLRGHYALPRAPPARRRRRARRARSRAAVRYLKTRLLAGAAVRSLARARRAVRRLARPDRNRRAARDRPLPRRRAAGARSARRCGRCRRRASTASGHAPMRVPIDGYLKHGGCFYRAPERLVHQRVELRFDRDQVWIVHRGQEVARYRRSYEQGVWLPPPMHAARAAAARRRRSCSPRLDGRAARARRLRGAVRMSPQGEGAASGCPTCSPS